MTATSPRVWKHAFACLILLILLAPDSLAADRKEILRQARAAYYNLKTQGMVGFQCQVKPEWEFLDKVMTDDEGHNKVMPILRQVHFKVVVGPSGDTTVSHQSGEDSPNSDVAERVKKVVDGFDQIISGFFQTWQGFMTTSPFPEVEDSYQLEDLGEKFKLNYHQENTEVQMTMDRGFAIREVVFKMPQANVTLQPRFDLEGNKFVLSGYDFENVLPSGENQQGSVTIQNQNLDGLVFPLRVGIKMMVDSEVAEPAFDFTDYQVKKR
jgi:hypothetical protein